MKIKPDPTLLSFTYGLRRISVKVPVGIKLPFVQGARLADFCAGIPPHWHGVLAASLNADPSGDLLGRVASAILR